MEGRREASVKELTDRNFAEASLQSNLMVIESYEVRARAALLGRVELPTSLQENLSQSLVEDAHHLHAMATASSGWVSQDLTHSLESSLRDRNAVLVELGHILLVEPAVKALAELLAPARLKVENILSKMAVEEEKHYRVYSELSTLVADLDKAFAEYVAASGLLLYVTVFPSDEGRTMLLTLLGRPADEHSFLRTFYSTVDKLRMEAVSNLFGPDSASFGEVKGYGLARSGLC